MDFTIKEYIGYEEDEILDLYGKVGWINYTNDPKMLRNAFAHSLCTLGAFITEKKERTESAKVVLHNDSELAGIIRAVGDGFSIVVVQDLLVMPKYQRKGIGRALMEKILEKYREAYQIQLMTDNTPKTIAFYKALGFKDVADIGCRGFMRM